jgi:hypothetical protein
MDSMSVLAIMSARNEAGYIETTLRTLLEEGLEVILIDNGSIDGTRELAQQFLGDGLLDVRHLGWNGHLDLAQLLELKQQLFADSRHEWHMHVDADEWPRAHLDDATLADFLMREVSTGFSVVNFDEFVFLPPYGVDMWAQDYRKMALSYYFFEPTPKRLMRAWRRKGATWDIAGAGHRLSHVPDSAIYPQNLTMRHYIGLSFSHAITKRANRSYPAAALARGWHRNRLDLRAARPVIDSPYVKQLLNWDDLILDNSSPSMHHFWEAGFHHGDTPEL